MSKFVTPEPRLYSGFVLFFDHWDDGEPVMCLGSRTVRDKIPGFIMPNSVKSPRAAFVIPLKSAYLYANSESGAPSEYLVKRSLLIAAHIGLDQEKSTVRRIAEAIVDNIAELIRMPRKSTAPTMKQIERKAEKYGLVVEMDGEKILDAN